MSCFLDALAFLELVMRVSQSVSQSVRGYTIFREILDQWFSNLPTLQPYNHTTLQPYNLTNFNITTLIQPYNLTTLQSYTLTILQPYRQKDKKKKRKKDKRAKGQIGKKVKKTMIYWSRVKNLIKLQL